MLWGVMVTEPLREIVTADDSCGEIDDVFEQFVVVKGERYIVYA